MLSPTLLSNPGGGREEVTLPFLSRNSGSEKVSRLSEVPPPAEAVFTPKDTLSEGQLGSFPSVAQPLARFPSVEILQ